MKNYKIYLSLIFILVAGFFSCELKENPNFLSSDNLFEDVDGANIALNGVYAAMIDFGYYSSEYHHSLNYTSGMYNSNRDGSLKDIAALNPSPNDKFITNLWAGIFRTISRANNTINQLEEKDLGNPGKRDEILGQALFIRALAYFDLVRVFGKAPLITTAINSDDPSTGMATPDEIFAQIIEDGEKAAELMVDLGDNEAGRPAKYAADMLMAKVYMWLAGNKTAAETDYWQKAYDHAIKVFGKYELMDNFGDLWQDETRNNNKESIFELQGNVENPIKLLKYWTASKATLGGNTWARFKPNLEVYDRHLATYPDDPRIQYTFVTEYNKYKPNGKFTVIKTYPKYTKRNNKDKSYPYGYKYFIRNAEMINTDSDLNFVLFRYADLLLMLAEIENELNGPENAYQYVNEVLTRARNSSDSTATSPANWSGLDQESFRQAITKEYIFELQQEGQDFFNVRRRGYDFFKKFVIEAHNNHTVYDFSKVRDVEFPDNNRIMVLPIPETEINTNGKISITDQNPGY